MRELFNRVWKKEEGFSLIELIIVIAILAIIAAIAVPNLLNNIQRANMSTDESNGKMIADAISTYIAQNPEYEGATYGTAAAPLDFGTIGSPSTDGENSINGAITILNGNVPVIKNNDNGEDGNQFHVFLASSGAIEVFEDAGAAHKVFPK